MNIRFLYLGVVLFCAGCATVPYDQVIPQDGGDDYIAQPVHWKKELYLKDICQQHGIDWHFDRIAQVVSLTKFDKQAKVMIGSPMVIVERQGKIFLDEALAIDKSGAIVVPRDFRRKVLRVFDAGTPGQKDYSIQKIRKIIIDAGHGGKDPGALGRTGVQEKQVVLDIAQRLGKLLQKEGVEVVYTRDRDDFISLQERTEIASKEKADLFVSIHANAAPERSVSGVEVFHLKPLTWHERMEKQRQDNQKRLYKSMNVYQSDAHVHNILDDLLYTHKQADSYYLARDLSQRISKDIRVRNRGMKNARFFVLRNTLIPAVLIEVGFLTNAKEEKNLKSNVYRQRIARSIAEGIVSHAKN